MKSHLCYWFIASLLSFPVSAAIAGSDLDNLPKAQAEIVDRQGEPIGEAQVQQGPNGTVLHLELQGLPPGAKGIHIHQVGTCDDHEDGFQASGSHLNPDDSQHGMLNAEGPDAGDLANFRVSEEGSARAEFFNERASLDGSFGARILDDDGAALVIHQNPDDHTTQPIGGAGERIACGVITAQ